MAFRVEVSPRAYRDLDDIARYIQDRGSFEQAEQWFNGIMHAIQRLEHMPERCRVAHESTNVGEEIRLLLYGKRNHKYRVYFSIHHQTSSRGLAYILHVRHWARRGLTADQLREFAEDAE